MPIEKKNAIKFLEISQKFDTGLDIFSNKIQIFLIIHYMLYAKNAWKIQISIDIHFETLFSFIHLAHSNFEVISICRMESFFFLYSFLRFYAHFETFGTMTTTTTTTLNAFYLRKIHLIVKNR